MQLVVRFRRLLVVRELPPLRALAQAVLVMVARELVRLVLAVPLVARLLLKGGPITADTLVAQVAAVKADLEARGIPAPRRDPKVAVAAGLADLRARGALDESGTKIAVKASEVDLVSYYARSIEHHFDAPAAGISATAG